MSTPARTTRAAGALTAATLLLATACGAPQDGSGADGAAPSATPSSSAPAEPTESTEPTVDPDAPTGWGPTEGELADAQEMAAAMTDAELAGQVVVGRYRGADPAEAAAMVRDLHLAGLSVTSDNLTDEAQARAMTAAISRAVAADGRDVPAVVGVDQEGGTVEQLRGIATTFPAFAEAGEALAADPQQGRRVVTAAADAAGLELRDLGFTWVFGPVADVTIGAADPTIGSRSPSPDVDLATEAVVAALAGYADAGLVTTTKHFPGHGAVTSDSHLTLPELDSTLAELRARDLRPFEAAVDAGAPAVMMSHIALDALAPGEPATLAAPVYELLRDEVGFEGVVITDSLGMGAVVGRDTPAVQALNAGADLLLMPADTEATHATLTAAIGSGTVPRDRAEQAAARVIALQRWQARTAAAVPVPDDVGARAEQAAADLAAAG
ncbi:glycoside hydrolase family 3 protein [Nocardioides sp. AX2bis]|uniref:glycoside hydrolase family 3 protein n=1 Tax=Nocardioides sp. AX2bis TaxID=2653157 RepID=UPI0012F4573D|nr:glycoside hydrolase family 3 N-terminal domain-containing protein [Nocardioides sp. AX2bis]VXC50254.1 Beta-hexosaminidase [Nocardioides sp. AX2bis]